MQLCISIIYVKPSLSNRLYLRYLDVTYEITDYINKKYAD